MSLEGKRGHAVASPSLALIKYWGKQDQGRNTPATGSLAVTLDSLKTTTEATWAEFDSVTVNKIPQELGRYQPFLTNLKTSLGLGSQGLAIVSENNFPTAAGLASSSSGFAALVGAVSDLAQIEASSAELSRWAREGSGSATRSIYGGFTVYDAGAEEAIQEWAEDFWPDFRVVLCVVRDEAKATSSRKAMELSRTTSPFYQNWVQTSPALLSQARSALAQRDWSALGPIIRQSYLRMFSTMFTSEPPVIFWQPESLAVIQALATLRNDGLSAWETMDAGPQVKVFCPANEVETIVAELGQRVPGLRYLVAGPGPGLRRGSIA